MKALIYARNSEGCIGKCDAKCYNATHKDCDCICGGKNHEKGLEKATENTIKSAKKWMKEYKKKHKEAKQFGFKKDLFQIKLL